MKIAYFKFLILLGFLCCDVAQAQDKHKWQYEGKRRWVETDGTVLAKGLDESLEIHSASVQMSDDAMSIVCLHTYQARKHADCAWFLQFTYNDKNNLLTPDADMQRKAAFYLPIKDRNKKSRLSDDYVLEGRNAVIPGKPGETQYIIQEVSDNDLVAIKAAPYGIGVGYFIGEGWWRTYTMTTKNLSLTINMIEVDRAMDFKKYEANKVSDQKAALKASCSHIVKGLRFGLIYQETGESINATVTSVDKQSGLLNYAMKNPPVHIPKEERTGELPCMFIPVPENTSGMPIAELRKSIASRINNFDYTDECDDYDTSMFREQDITRRRLKILGENLDDKGECIDDWFDDQVWKFKNLVKDAGGTITGNKNGKGKFSWNVNEALCQCHESMKIVVDIILEKNKKERARINSKIKRWNRLNNIVD